MTTGQSSLLLRGNHYVLPSQPLVMAIVNLVADSFSGDGVTDISLAVERAKAAVRAGADIVDIGAESARTNRAPISEAEEAAQLIRFIERWGEIQALGEGRKFPLLLSINTWRPAVARAALAAGGDFLNDISGLPDTENARVCADRGAILLIMHSVGLPKVPHTHVQYADVMQTMEAFFESRIECAMNVGVPGEAIVIDPGIDFAKQRDDNLRVYRELERLHRFGKPILLPVSRKTVIGHVLDLANPADRDAGTVACVVAGCLRGAKIFRVHNVPAAVRAVRMMSAIYGR